MDNIFLDNKYSKIYFNICNKVNSRNPEIYFEIHHIVPKSFGGSNRNHNLVNLTAREHFIVHMLLPKMCISVRHKMQMVRALVRMCGRKNETKSGRNYETARKIISQNSKGNMNPSFGKFWSHDPLTLQIKYSNILENGFVKGLPHQRGGFEKGSMVWINDGITSKMISSETIPIGWKKGRIVEVSENKRKNGAKARHTKEKDADHSLKMKNRISIFKDGVYRNIPKSELHIHTELGWIVKTQPKKHWRPVEIDGIHYNTVPEAARALSIIPQTIAYRLNNLKWKNWKYV